MLFMPVFNLDGTAKKLDSSNRIKVLEDAIAEATGIDDRYFWSVHIEKRHSRDNIRAVIQLEQMTRNEVQD